MLYDLAELTRLSYKQVNVLIFCIIWPLVTIMLIAMLNQERKKSKILERKIKEIEEIDIKNQ